MTLVITEPSLTDTIITVITTDGTATGKFKIIVHYIMYTVIVSSCV